MPKPNGKTKQALNQLNETGKRSTERRQALPAAPIQSERRKVQRRRQIDPTTCERDYTEPEIEFMQALDDYKRTSGRMFPTCSEVLEVLMKLGYRKVINENHAAPVNAHFSAQTTSADSLV